MADSKLTGLTATTSVVGTDLAYVVVDPAGTPLSRKITIANLFTGPTLTAPVTVTGVVGSSAITINGATQTASFPFITATQTWNNAGVTFTAIKANITSTASAAASLLMDLQVAGVSQHSFRKDGVFRPLVGIHSLDTALYLASSGLATTGQIAINAAGFSQRLDGQLGWTAGNPGTNDTYFVRDAAGVIGVKDALRLTEMTAPVAGAANTVRIFAQDNGSGKTQLMAIFASGAAQQVAIEP